MKKLTKTEEYAMFVYESLINLFTDEEDCQPMQQLYFNKIDATKFFTGMVISCGLFFNKLTSGDETSLSFTYLANQLVVQHLLEGKK